MPHLIKEQHLDEICASCKKPHGSNIELIPHHHKIYEVIICINCGYEIIKLKEEEQFNDRFQFM
jgi:C4-type Zn-finger protein